MYQTVFATEPGSAEMPSAGRPFTPELVTRLVSRGVQVAPLLLHTGVASLEDHEPPYEEFYRVPRETADLVNAARRAGHRVVAVGTTVVRALETVTDETATTFPGEGWTSLVITRGRPVRSVHALITGLHEARASHLMMLEQVAETARHHGPSGSHVCGRCHLERAYAEARQAGYLWHEFGDAHLILGRSSSRARRRPARVSRRPWRHPSTAPVPDSTLMRGQRVSARTGAGAEPIDGVSTDPARGTLNRNRLPPPGCDAQVTVPRLASTAALAIARPSP